ncbi:unnamed protein product [Hermetia illucens]|uniref:Uncharacterized protein n=1 Tax=Hermetia illucens TaxID=343691 RepID=A0A7R8V352_HERIL|nr:monocarboxylate transporter 7-like [Hermetia illucens]CAD7091335.1 unnamed protein product [Hermetia illucens]
MNGTSKSNKKPKYKLEAPEGGWGYLVCVGMGLVLLGGTIGMHCYGLIFNDFLKSIGVGTSVVAIANGCSFGVMSIAGLFSNTLIQRFDKRSVGVAGGFLFVLGGLVQTFAHSAMHLFIAAGVQGAAFGFMIPIMFSTFNHYFVTRRAMMMSVTQSIIGVGHMFVPIVIEHLLDKYGFRGCVALITAFSGNCILGMLVMHPVEWHMKKVPITEEDESNQEEGEKHEIGKAVKGRIKDEDSHQLKPLIAEMKDKGHMKSIVSLRRAKLADSVSNSRRSSLASYSNWTGSVIITEAIEPQPKTTGKWKLIVDFLDLSLLKQPVYVNIVLGITLAFYADLSFFSFQPLYLFELEYTKLEVSRVIAVGAGADLLSRCALVVLNAVAPVPARYIFLAGAIASIISRFAFLYVRDFWAMAGLTAIIGFFKTWMHIPMPLVFAEYLPKERFSSGYGLFMFLQGVIMFAIGPVVGYIRDLTRSYYMAFQYLNVCLFINVISWLQEIIWLQCRKPKAMSSNEGEKPEKQPA